MAIYEQRVYDITVGQMSTVIALYREQGFPALQSGSFDDNLVGYFISDTGPLHQLIHLWRFDDDAARRAFWKGLFADDTFMAFAAKLRPNIERQQVQLLTSAPWGPNP